MKNFPELFTDRLRLGKIRTKDLPIITEYANNKSISDNTLSFPFPYTEESAVFWMQMEIKGFENKKDYIFAIYEKESDDFIGGIGLHTDKINSKGELGYWIAEPFWNRGYASEAGNEVIKFGFNELGLNKILATHFLYNSASKKVLQKIGMYKEAKIKHHYFKNGKFEDVIQYCLLKAEFKKQNL